MSIVTHVPPIPGDSQNSQGTSKGPWNLSTDQPKLTVAEILANGRQCTTGIVSTKTPYTHPEGTFPVDSYWPLSPQKVQPTPPQPDTTHTANANRQKTIPDATQQRQPLSEVAEPSANARHRTKGERLDYSVFHTTGKRQPLK